MRQQIEACGNIPAMYGNYIIISMEIYCDVGQDMR